MATNKSNKLVQEFVAGMMQQPADSIADLGDDVEVKKPLPVQTPVQKPTLSEEEKMIIRQARSAKQGRPTNAERAAHEANPQEGKKAIGVQISESLYARLDKALARTGQTKRDFVEGLLEREFKKLGV